MNDTKTVNFLLPQPETTRCGLQLLPIQIIAPSVRISGQLQLIIQSFDSPQRDVACFSEPIVSEQIKPN
jgi:hypothetical protein